MIFPLLSIKPHLPFNLTPANPSLKYSPLSNLGSIANFPLLSIKPYFPFNSTFANPSLKPQISSNSGFAIISPFLSKKLHCPSIFTLIKSPLTKIPAKQALPSPSSHFSL